MAEIQDSTSEGHPVLLFLDLVRDQIRQAHKSKQGEEVVVVSVFTPEGRTIAQLFDGAEPDRIIVHGYRQGHRTTVIAPLGSIQVAIEVLQKEEEPKERQMGFRLLD